MHFSRGLLTVAPVMTVHTKRPRHTPYEGGRHEFKIGLAPLAARDWIEPSSDLGEELTYKKQTLAARGTDAFNALTGSEPASAEVLAALVDYLPKHFPGEYTCSGDVIEIAATGDRYPVPAPMTTHPLDIAARLVPDDLCVMEERGEEWVLTAASLCSPGGWKLADKIGKPMAAIHAPVPTFVEKLANRSVRIFDALRPGQIVGRSNWHICPLPGRWMVGEAKTRAWAEAASITPEDAGVRLWMRVERQTLQKMPETAAILFTIRTYIDPLNQIAQHQDLRRALLTALETVPGVNARHAGMPVFIEPLKSWLARAH